MQNEKPKVTKSVSKSKPKAPSRRGKKLTAYTKEELIEIFRRFSVQRPEPKGELEHVNPFTLVVATPALNTQFERKMGFSIGGNRTCNINVVLNIDRLLQGIDPWQTPIIESDPTKPGDFAEAVKIKQNLVPAFVIQI